MIQNFSRYQVFPSVGKIYDKKRKRFVKEYMQASGYFYVNLQDDEGNWKCVSFHRTILMAYMGEGIPDGLQVNHINEDKTNNQIKNLNLMTPKENINWGTCIERRAKSLTNHPNKSKRVQAFDKKGDLIYDFPSSHEAERQGFKHSNIIQCCKGKRQYHKGYYWKYA